MTTQTTKPTVVFALIGAAVLWGLSFVATKVALTEFDQFTLVFCRFVAAAVFFTVVMSIRGFPRFDRSIHIRLLLIAIFEPVLYFLAETAGLERTTAAKASLIIATIPGVVLLFSRLFLKEHTGVKRIAGALISIAGVGVLVLGDPSVRIAGLSGALGDLLIVGAVGSAVVYMLIARTLSGRVSAVEITGFQFIYGTILFAPIYLAGASRQIWSAITPTGISMLAYLIVGASIGAFLCYNYALTHTETSRAAVYLNGIPIVATATGWVALGERMAPVQAVGALIVLGGIYLVSRK